MKMFYGNTPVNSLNVRHYEMDTNSATMIPSDLQAGVTAFAKGKKVTGTGKAFEFASYGMMETNKSKILPSTINVIEISSLTNPVQLIIALSDMKNVDFSSVQTVGNVIVDNISYPLNVQVVDNKLTILCDKSVFLEVFYGKDNYI